MSDEFKVFLAGNANVGKSVLMNKLTGLGVIISNYPGTTVELERGEVKWGDRELEVVDLPGIYSLDAGSMDEEVAVRSILEEEPDVIVNVIDATNLERNLYLTVQLIELGFPMVIALNQMDRVHARGMEISVGVLSELLGVPVVPTTAVSGVGLHELLRVALEEARVSDFRVDYDFHIEQAVDKISEKLREEGEGVFSVPRRTFGLGLLLDNPVFVERVSEDLRERVGVIRDRIEELHGEPVLVHASRDRFGVCGELGREVVLSQPGASFSEWVSQLTLRGPVAVLLMLLVFGFSFWSLIRVGGFLEGVFLSFFDWFNPFVYSVVGRGFLAEGVVVGVEAGFAIVVPYISVFYLVLGFLEDSGYLPRVAALLDDLMHGLGLHGKAVIPILLGYGCNVPAVLGTRVLSSRREKLLTAVLICLGVPCSAQTSVVLGLAGHYLGFWPALSIYGVTLVLLLLSGWFLGWFLPGERFGLVMELPPFRLPDWRAVLGKTFLRLREFFFIALPLIVVGSVVLSGLRGLGWLSVIEAPLVPVTNALGLPRFAAVPLVYGLLRKEMTLESVALLAGSTDFSQVFSPVQMFVFSLVMAVYMPCVATMAALWKEFGLKDTILITLVTIFSALFLGFSANLFISSFGLL